MRRPVHPDFWALSAIIIALDAVSQTMSPTSDDNPISRAVDEETLIYVSEQRVARALEQFARGRIGNNLERVLQMIYIDAFVTGVQFQQGGGHTEGTPGSQTGEQ